MQTATGTSLFQDCQTVEEVKTTYKRLAFAYHPDLNPAEDRERCTQLMQSLNRDYELELAKRDQEVSAPNAEGETRTYKYNEGREKEVVDIINKTIELFAHSEPTQALGYNPMLKVIGTNEDGSDQTEVELYLVGTWLWLKGHNEVTKAYRQLLNRKGLGYDWSPEKLMWYWRSESSRTGYHGKGDFASIAAKYGAERIVSDDDRKGNRGKRFKGGNKTLKKSR